MITSTSSSIIDHVATACARNIVKSGVLEASLSNYFMVYCIFKFNGEVVKGQKVIKIMKMKNSSEEAFLADVSNICWEQMPADIDEIIVLVNNWYNLVYLVIEKHAPIRTVKFGNLSFVR